ncbi:Gfo/Idh/MocA family oxidoreductase [Nocardia sp. CNY236]|uniref:Gfo/Idh/MocA family oxidoreductase n=1 Tax=Nocardia sp. CNY236 TaxID=1169152 RepID=UPI00048E11F4|nr:Gfo/Idh/MocA family oxidoreductase [Nocardia sp. CNY236]
MSPLRVAVVGYGLAGAVFHAPLIAVEPRMRVAAVVTSSAERAERAIREHPGARVLSTVTQLFDDPSEIDLVVIATPNRSHAPLAMSAIEAGLPVVVDKPFTVTVAEAEQVVAAAEKAQVPLSVFQNRRWDSDFRTVESLIAANRLGHVHRFESRIERWRPEPKGGWRELGDETDGAGYLYDLGSHLIDQALTLFGPVAEIYCELDRRRTGVRADDDAFLALTHANGVRSHLWMNAVAAQHGPRFRVLGSDNAYVVYGTDPQEAQLRAGRRPDHEHWGTVHPEDWGELGIESDARRVRSLPGDYRCYYRAMADTLLVGTPVPVDARDALETMKILEHARLAHAQTHPEPAFGRM